VFTLVINEALKAIWISFLAGQRIGIIYGRAVEVKKSLDESMRCLRALAERVLKELIAHR
jgi:hypothetical protein